MKDEKDLLLTPAEAADALGIEEGEVQDLMTDGRLREVHFRPEGEEGALMRYVLRPEVEMIQQEQDPRALAALINNERTDHDGRSEGPRELANKITGGDK